MRFIDYDSSMGNVEIVIECEKEFVIDITDEEAQSIETFQQMVRFLDWRTNRHRGL